MNDKKPIVGWKAAIVVAGMAGFLILGSFVMKDHDRTASMASTPPAGVTAGIAPQPQTK